MSGFIQAMPLIFFWFSCQFDAEREVSSTTASEDDEGTEFGEVL